MIGKSAENEEKHCLRCFSLWKEVKAEHEIKECTDCGK